MNQFRKNQATKVFKALDSTGSGSIPMEQLKEMYVAARHPDVLTHRKSEDEALTEFLDTFEEYYYFVVRRLNKHSNNRARRRTDW